MGRHVLLVVDKTMLDWKLIVVKALIVTRLDCMEGYISYIKCEGDILHQQCDCDLA